MGFTRNPLFIAGARTCRAGSYRERQTRDGMNHVRRREPRSRGNGGRGRHLEEGGGVGWA